MGNIERTTIQIISISVLVIMLLSSLAGLWTTLAGAFNSLTGSTIPFATLFSPSSVIGLLFAILGIIIVIGILFGGMER